MRYKALKSFLHDQLGRVEKGAEFDATPAQIGGVERFIEVYQTKVTREVSDVAHTDRTESTSENRSKPISRKRAARKPT
jgi:hypothetical protein